MGTEIIHDHDVARRQGRISESATDAAQAGDNFTFARTRPLDMSAYRRNGR
jgi:hypothetical protein